ncbi:SDR family oxidoreductase [Hyphococcus luteus]|uniref:SDR family oxidoreductase n=1 Tax=Hyphococcus luteus TaxID=2058213 RepID=UPI0013FDB546|nr:SDR family oxidoreductase [Marinicaulis flavus]
MTAILITGANRGIGLEFVKQYAGEGARVHACCRVPEKADALNAVEGDVVTHKLDVSDFGAVKALGKEIDEPLDIVVANAGAGGKDVGEFGALDYDAFLHLLAVNTLGPVATLEAFAPHLKKAKGKFAAISSILGSIANAGGFAQAYSTSKAGLNMALKAYAPVFADTGVAIAPFHPGWVKTDMGGPEAAVAVEDSVAGLRERIEKMKPGAPLRLTDYQGNEIGW